MTNTRNLLFLKKLRLLKRKLLKNCLLSLLFALPVLLIGMATIFSVLCLIWLCLSLFKVFFHDLKTKKPATVKAAEVEEVKEVAQYQTNDEEIIAVIAAAIAMAESESTGVKFRVVSFKRK